MMLGKVRKDFSVQHYVFLFEAVNKFGVSRAEFSGAGVYFYIPKFYIVRLFVFSMRKSVISGMQECLFGLALFGTATMAHTFGLFQNTSPSLQCVYSLFYSGHS